MLNFYQSIIFAVNVKISCENIRCSCILWSQLDTQNWSLLFDVSVLLMRYLVWYLNWGMNTKKMSRYMYGAIFYVFIFCFGRCSSLIILHKTRKVKFVNVLLQNFLDSKNSYVTGQIIAIIFGWLDPTPFGCHFRCFLYHFNQISPLLRTTFSGSHNTKKTLEDTFSTRYPLHRNHLKKHVHMLWSTHTVGLQKHFIGSFFTSYHT